MNMVRTKELPRGEFISFHNLPFETLPEDVQSMISRCTGVEIPVANIEVRQHEHLGVAAAMVSFEKPHIVALLAWALQGEAVDVCIPKRAGGR